MYSIYIFFKVGPLWNVKPIEIIYTRYLKRAIKVVKVSLQNTKFVENEIKHKVRVDFEIQFLLFQEVTYY